MSETKIHDKLDKLAEGLAEVNVHLAKYNTQLEYHIDRTDRLEALVMDTKEEIVPLKAHVEQWNGAGKLVTWASTIVGILAAVGGAIMWFKH